MGRRASSGKPFEVTRDKRCEHWTEEECLESGCEDKEKRKKRSRKRPRMIPKDWVK